MSPGKWSVVLVASAATSCLTTNPEWNGAQGPSSSTSDTLGLPASSSTDGGTEETTSDGGNGASGTAGSDSDSGEAPEWMPPENALYIGPEGDDANPGTADAPYKTWAFALAQLKPGDFLVAYPGEYSEASQTGTLYADCSLGATACDGAPCESGIDLAPITVRALYERRSQIDGRDSLLEAAVLIRECAHWTIHGFDVVGYDDIEAVHQYPIMIDSGRDLVFRRMVAREPNRYAFYPGVGIMVSGGRAILLEENEIYDFTGTGVTVWYGDGIVWRRNYINSRTRLNVDGAVPGTTGIFSGGSPQNSIETNVVENNVVEGGTYGILVDRGRLYGNVVRDAAVGYFFQYAPDTMVLRDNVAFEVGQGYRFDPLLPATPRIEHNSSIHYRESGYAFAASEGSFSGASIVASLAVTNEATSSGFVAGNSGGSLSVTSPLTSCNAWSRSDGPTAYAPAEIRPAENAEIDPQLGDCAVVYIPESSPMKGAGPDATDIGANLISRLEDGEPTGQALWDQDTGQFPCGAMIQGVNDGDQACLTVHQQLRVGAFGCPIPSMQ